MNDNKVHALQHAIDLCREKLNQMLIDDPEIIKVSRELDELLNKYIKLKDDQ